jgi:hypothetical protein
MVERSGIPGMSGTRNGKENVVEVSRTGLREELGFIGFIERLL